MLMGIAECRLPSAVCDRHLPKLETRIAKLVYSSRGLDGLLRRVRQAVGRRDLETRLPQDRLALIHVRALQTHDHRDREPHLAYGRDDPVGDDVAAHDAAED